MRYNWYEELLALNNYKMQELQTLLRETQTGSLHVWCVSLPCFTSFIALKQPLTAWVVPAAAWSAKLQGFLPVQCVFGKINCQLKLKPDTVSASENRLRAAFWKTFSDILLRCFLLFLVKRVLLGINFSCIFVAVHINKAPGHSLNHQGRACLHSWVQLVFVTSLNSALAEWMTD